MLLKLLLLVLSMVVCTWGITPGGIVYMRTVEAPVCTGGLSSCSLLGRDFNQRNNQAQNTNLTTVRLVSSNSLTKAVYTYQGSTLAGKQLPISAQASITFVNIAEWVDTNADNIPQSNELSNVETLTTPLTPTFTVNSFLTPAYMPFTTAVAPTANFSVICYIVKNNTYFVPPDSLFVTGYGATCHLHITRSTPISPGSRIALRVNVDTSLTGYSVGTSPTNFLWSIFSGQMGSSLVIGNSYFRYRQKALVAGHASSDVDVKIGPSVSTGNSLLPNERTFAFGLVLNDAYSFDYDISFEPVQILYDSAASLSISMFSIMAMIVVAFSF